MNLRMNFQNSNSNSHKNSLNDKFLTDNHFIRQNRRITTRKSNEDPFTQERRSRTTSYYNYSVNNNNYDQDNANENFTKFNRVKTDNDKRRKLGGGINDIEISKVFLDEFNEA